jgi:hypothetical protein
MLTSCEYEQKLRSTKETQRRRTLMKTPDAVLAYMKNQYRDRDIRNAAVYAWRHIIDAKGGQAEQWDFVNGIRMAVLSGRPIIHEPHEILIEWQKVAWIEYSPDGSTIRITSAGIEQLKKWEEEDRTFKAVGAHEKIRSLLDDVSNLKEENGVKVKHLIGRAEMIISQIFGKSSLHFAALREIQFHGSVYDSAIGRDVGGPFRRGKEAFTNLCNRMLEDLGPEPNYMPLKERLVAGEPARNLIKIQNIIGNLTVTGIHDPYTTAATLTTIHKLADVGTKFDVSLRLLGTLRALDKPTKKKSLISLLNDLNTERNTTWEIKTYIQATNPHRRFLVLNDGSVVTCGMSLNDINKDEVLDREPAGSENAIHDQGFFDDKWKTGTPV